MPATEINIVCRIHKSMICSFQCWQANGQLNSVLKLSAKLRSLPGKWHMVYNVAAQARGCTFKRSSDAAQSQTTTSTTGTTSFSTWLNERCKRGTTKRHRLCQNRWEYCRLCSPTVILILQSASTSAVLKHTLAWSCYKANCSLSQTRLDHAVLPACECIFVCRLSLLETC